MSYICDICGKGKQFGHNVSFSQRKTKRVFKPNLHVKKLEIDGQPQRLKVCTQCLRTLKKDRVAVAESKTAEKISKTKATQTTAKTTK